MVNNRFISKFNEYKIVLNKNKDESFDIKIVNLSTNSCFKKIYFNYNKNDNFRRNYNDICLFNILKKCFMKEEEFNIKIKEKETYIGLNIKALIDKWYKFVLYIEIPKISDYEINISSSIILQNMLICVINNINTHFGTTYSINDIEKCKKNKDDFNIKCVKKEEIPKYENIIGEKYRLYIRFNNESYQRETLRKDVTNNNIITNSFYIVVNNELFDNDLHSNYVYTYYVNNLKYESYDVVGKLLPISQNIFNKATANMNLDEKDEFIKSFMNYEFIKSFTDNVEIADPYYTPEYSEEIHQSVIKNKILQIFNTNKYKYNGVIFGGMNCDVLKMDYKYDDSIFKYFIVPI
jgi:hypothetical protein